MSEDNFTTLYPQRWVPIGLSSNPFAKWLRTCKRQQVATDMQHQVKPKQRSQQLKGAPNLGQSGKQTSASDKNMHAHQFTHRERQKEMSTRKKQHKQVRAADALSIFLTTKCHCKSMDIPTTGLTLWFSSVPMPLILPVVLPAWVALPKSSTMFSNVVAV